MATSVETNVGMGLSIATFPATLAGRQIVDFTLPAALGVAIDTSHQGTTAQAGGVGVRTFIGGDLLDGGELELTCHHQIDYDYWLEVGTEGSCVVTLPMDDAGTGAATLTFTAVFVSYTPQATALDGLILADAVLKVASDVTVAAQT